MRTRKGFHLSKKHCKLFFSKNAVALEQETLLLSTPRLQEYPFYSAHSQTFIYNSVIHALADHLPPTHPKRHSVSAPGHSPMHSIAAV